MIEALLIAIAVSVPVALIITISFSFGHSIGYQAGRSDTLARAKESDHGL